MEHSIIVFITSILYAATGSILLWLGYRIFDKLTPGDAHAKIFEEGNIAVSILVGAFVLGLSLIIAAAMVG
ncbi:DUF350 domain-containing protein [Leptospira sp. 96542]|nr:DUF350 domain-containing protein [Leptospira sp. 96542]